MNTKIQKRYLPGRRYLPAHVGHPFARHPAQRWLLVLAAILALVILTPLLLTGLGAFLIHRDPFPTRRVAAIVPLAGAPSRIVDAAALFHNDAADWFLVTNSWVHEPDVYNHPRSVYSTRASREAKDAGVPLSQLFVAGKRVHTTYEELQAIRQFAETREWDSLLIVTSPSHTYRSRMLADEVFRDSPITVTIIPVADHWYTAETWWLHVQGWHETLLEYAKLALYPLGMR